MIRTVYQLIIDLFGKTPRSQVYIRKLIRRYKTNLIADPRFHWPSSSWYDLKDVKGYDRY